MQHWPLQQAPPQQEPLQQVPLQHWWLQQTSPWALQLVQLAPQEKSLSSLHDDPVEPGQHTWPVEQDLPQPPQFCALSCTQPQLVPLPQQ